MKILVTPTSLCKNKNIETMKRLAQFSDEIVYNPYGRPLLDEEILKLLPGVDGIIAGVDHFSKEVIYSAPEILRVISRYGVGYDCVDIESAGKRNIFVTNTPGANSNAVADLAIGLMISTARSIPFLDRKIHEGEWTRSTGIELYNKTIGIVGLGAIGKGVAIRAKGFSMRLLAYDPYIDQGFAVRNGITPVSFETLLQESDFITLHLPVNENTRNIINANSISKMKNGVILINTSRGGLMDESAVCDGLKDGKIGGVGVDAFSIEPPVNNPMLKFENVIATPHTGAHTREAEINMANMAVKNLIDVIEGRECPYIVNREYIKN